jgi:selenocysteine-specific elongation factor
MAITAPERWAVTNVVDIVFSPAPGAPDLPTATTMSVHVGSSERAARWRRLDPDASTARLRFDVALPLQPGDHLVLRSTAQRAIVGGGVVYDVQPTRRARMPLPATVPVATDVIVGRYPWSTRQRIVQLGGFDPTTIDNDLEALRADGGLHEFEGAWVDHRGFETIAETIRTLVTSHHERHPDDLGLSIHDVHAALDFDARVARSIVEQVDGLVIEHDVVRLAEHERSVEASPQGQRFLDALRAHPFAPPAPAEIDIDPATARLLARQGLVQQLDGLWFATEAIDEAAVRVSRALLERETLTMSELRNVLDTTRKFALPLANALDAAGVTRRRGDQRIAGPRAHVD